jgi:hypothetical protein
MGTLSALRSAGLACCLLRLFPAGITSCDDGYDLGPPARGDPGGTGGSSSASGGSSAVGGRAGSAGSGSSAGNSLDACSDEASCVAAGYRTPPGVGRPPLPSPGAAGPDASALQVQAIRVLLLGDTDPDGSTNPEAWKQYGHDLDGWSSDEHFGAHCRPVSEKRADIRVDGDGGIDNSFGKNLINGWLGTALDGPTARLGAAIATGVGTTVVRIHGLAPSGDQVGLSTELFTVRGIEDAAGSAVAPTEQQWNDGSYAWRPLGEQLEGDGGSMFRSEGGYVVDDVWVSGELESFPIDIVIGEHRLTLRLTRALITGKLSADRRGIVSGNISGIMSTAAWVKTLDELYDGCAMHRPCNSLGDCTARNIGSDILDDGTQDPTRTCNGISVGFGFVTAPASLGEPTPVGPPPAYCGGP